MRQNQFLVRVVVKGVEAAYFIKTVLLKREFFAKTVRVLNALCIPEPLLGLLEHLLGGIIQDEPGKFAIFNQQLLGKQARARTGIQHRIIRIKMGGTQKFLMRVIQVRLVNPVILPRKLVVISGGMLCLAVYKRTGTRMVCEFEFSNWSVSSNVSPSDRFRVAWISMI